MPIRKALSKIVDLNRALDAVEAARNRGQKIAWTNGCFDLLHLGHVTYLEQARELGDMLIVGLNTDASVEALKGPGRPMVPLQARQKVIAALESVDYVLAFGDPTPIRCITTLKPDVVVKGGDYRPEQVVGAKEVRQWQGRVEVLPFIAGWSTTGMVKSFR